MFYKDLYTSKIKVKEKNIQNFLTHTKVPKLDDIEKIMCDRPIQITEIASALKELKNDKSPGTDGFSTNFFLFFSGQILGLYCLILITFRIKLDV